MPGDLVLAAFLVASLLAYALTGGADFGGGAWDGLAMGPRAEAQRALIKKTLAPVWEANHVWLIVIVVILFSCFPLAWTSITTALFAPLCLMLAGVVLRGAAFVFGAHAGPYKQAGRNWKVVFSVASTFTPVLLGVCLAGVATGRIRVDVVTGRVTSGFTSAWWTPWPWAVGVLVLVLFAFLAAAYLCVETDEPALRDDFRLRALSSGVLLGPLALGTLWSARTEAPAFFDALLRAPWSLAWQLVTGVTALAALGALWLRSHAVARILAAAQASMLVVGFALGMAPYLVRPDITLQTGAAPANVQAAVAWVLVLGTPVLVPAFVLLYRTFMRAR